MKENLCHGCNYRTGFGKSKEICLQASKEGIVIAANFNTPVQTVISGSKAGVEKACEILREIGAKRVVPLVVGGPFHSPLIEKQNLAGRRNGKYQIFSS